MEKRIFSVQNNEKMDNLQIAPLRSLDDFILAASRFQVPDVQNWEKVSNRIVSNLLYYQTNYFLSSMIIFILVALTHPQDMAIGIATIGVLFGLSLYLQNLKQELKEFKQRYPKLVIGIIVIFSYSIFYKLGSIMVVFLGMLLPIGFTLAHASLRLRNMKNKLVNASEALGIAKVTPMSLMLNEVGVESDIKVL